MIIHFSIKTSAYLSQQRTALRAADSLERFSTRNVFHLIFPTADLPMILRLSYATNLRWWKVMGIKCSKGPGNAYSRVTFEPKVIYE